MQSLGVYKNDYARKTVNGRDTNSNREETQRYLSCFLPVGLSLYCSACLRSKSAGLWFPTYCASVVDGGFRGNADSGRSSAPQRIYDFAP